MTYERTQGPKTSGGKPRSLVDHVREYFTKRVVHPDGTETSALDLGKVAITAAGAWAAYQLYKQSQFTKRSEAVRHGFESEPAIGGGLERTGAEVYLSVGSRGPIDILAEWSSRRVWGIQVKSSLNGEPKWPGGAEIERLVNECHRIGARPVVALRRGTRTTYYDARTRERIYPARG